MAKCVFPLEAEIPRPQPYLLTQGEEQKGTAETYSSQPQSNQHSNMEGTQRLHGRAPSARMSQLLSTFEPKQLANLDRVKRLPGVYNSPRESMSPMEDSKKVTSHPSDDLPTPGKVGDLMNMWKEVQSRVSPPSVRKDTGPTPPASPSPQTSRRLSTKANSDPSMVTEKEKEKERARESIDTTKSPVSPLEHPPVFTPEPSRKSIQWQDQQVREEIISPEKSTQDTESKEEKESTKGEEPQNAGTPSTDDNTQETHSAEPSMDNQRSPPYDKNSLRGSYYLKGRGNEMIFLAGDREEVTGKTTPLLRRHTSDLGTKVASYRAADQWLTHSPPEGDLKREENTKEEGREPEWWTKERGEIVKEDEESEDKGITIEDATFIIQKLIMERDSINQNFAKLRADYEFLTGRFQETMMLAMNYTRTSRDEMIPDFPKEIMEFRTELKQKMESEFLKLFPDSNKVQVLLRLLVNPTMILAKTMLSTFRLQDLDVLCNTLVKSFTYEDEMTRLLDVVITDEVERHRCSSTKTLCREDSICSKVITFYFKLIGPRYLHDVISPTIRTMNKSHSSFEIHEGKVSSDTRKNNMKKLKKIIVQLLDRIFKSIEQCPQEIRYSLLAVRCGIANSLSPGEDPLAYIGSFFFLRFICPVLVVPSLIGLRIPSARAQRGLILIAKVLQNLSNGILFGDKEEYMIEFNDILKQARPNFIQFLNELHGNNGRWAKESSQATTVQPKFKMSFVTSKQVYESLDELCVVAHNNTEALYRALEPESSLLHLIRDIIGEENSKKSLTRKASVMRAQEKEQVKGIEEKEFIRAHHQSRSLSELIEMQENITSKGTLRMQQITRYSTEEVFSGEEKKKEEEREERVLQHYFNEDGGILSPAGWSSMMEEEREEERWEEREERGEKKGNWGDHAAPPVTPVLSEERVKISRTEMELVKKMLMNQQERISQRNLLRPPT
ncbi:Ras GTPase activation domain-containing protein [Planoprotostelium fungivorum]|uniref:Ras GTPase activation domain-containing protein n=1 Tax=Planoprotostelium fungivorum TaxID=1890364 RepID=A0A2P6N9A4_9EUKA|nr:Ras GTPase activation domain-containing protein [Planoprotostelium fungivorum]